MPWSDGKSPTTTTLAWFLASWAQVLSWTETARRFSTSWDVVFEAVPFLDGWIYSAVATRIPPVVKLAKTLDQHRDLLLNWFRARGELAMGAVEGMNNKARVTTKLAYGFRSAEHAEIALYHRLGKLPEPPWLTHKFA